MDVLSVLFIILCSYTIHAKQPNIVISLFDDLGWNDVGYNNPKVHTPHINTLVDNGVKLERLYNYRFCSPSRSMLMTGVYPWKHGQNTDMNLNPVSTSRCAVQDRFKFLPELLGTKGYKSYMVGKWHLGHYDNKYTPTSRGFDRFVGFYAGGTNHMDACDLNGECHLPFTTSKCVCGESDRISCKYTKDGICTVANSLVDNIKTANAEKFRLVNVDKTVYSDDVLAEQAIDIIDAHDASKPMFMFLSWAAPHHPAESPEMYQAMNDLSSSKNCMKQGRRALLGMVAALDKNLEKVTNKLKSKSMWDNTILIGMSDNGGHVNSGDCVKARHGNNFPLRGGKFSFLEGGIRNVGFVSGPALPAGAIGTTWDSLVYSSDWFRMVASIAEVDANNIPDEQKTDNYDLWEAIVTNEPGARKEIPLQIWPEADRYVVIKEINNEFFKLIKGFPGQALGWGYLRTNYNKQSTQLFLPAEYSKSALKKKHSKIVKATKRKHTCIGKNVCLFNISQDIGEVKNLGKAKAYKSHMKVFNQLIDNLKSESVPFLESGICASGHYPTKSSVIVDHGSIARAKACNFFVPWVNAPQKCPETM